jgi:hypothetical protein
VGAFVDVGLDCRAILGLVDQPAASLERQALDAGERPLVQGGTLDDLVAKMGL